MNILFKKISLCFCVLLIFSISGCVSSKKYQNLENQYSLSQLQLIETQKQVDTLTQEKEELIQEKTELEAVKNKMIENLQSEIDEKSVQIQMIKEKLRVTAVEKLFFESGSAEVKKEGKAILDKIADTLRDSKNMEIHVVGHSDELPPGKTISKKYPSNWELSVNRATSIVQILQWGYGIDPKRIVAQGVAHYRPLVMETEKNRALNRVVEIYLTMMPDTE